MSVLSGQVPLDISIRKRNIKDKKKFIGKNVSQLII